MQTQSTHITFMVIYVLLFSKKEVFYYFSVFLQKGKYHFEKTEQTNGKYKNWSDFMKKLSSSGSFFLLLAGAFIVMFFSAFFLTRYSAAPQTSALSEPNETHSPVPAIVPESSSKQESPTPVITPSPEPDPAVTSMTVPAAGVITQKHSPETVVYSKTTDEWCVHCGIDISGEQTQVLAAAKGQVETVSEDGLLGTCVVLSHTGGLETKYYGLKQVFLTEGQSVEEGEPIGLTGSASPGEAAEGTHLHFEVWNQDEPLNPEDFFTE